MARRLRPHLPAAAGAALAVAAVCWLGLVDWQWTDYDREAWPAFTALAGGHVGTFLTLAPTYGGSLVLRAPFALVTGLLGGGDWAVFRAGSVPCVLAAAALGVWVVGQMRALGRPLLSRATVLALCAAGPITERALEFGHPEEILGAALCVAAVLTAGRGRTLWAGALLGLAIATKAWALVAVGPVLLALPARQWRALLVAGVVAATVIGPLAIAHPRAFSTKTASIATTGAIFQPWQAWWFLGEHGGPVRGTDGHVKPGYRTAPAWIDQVTHPLIVALGLVLTALLWLVRGRRRVATLDALLLLALLLHLRCVLDTWNFSYYAVPFLTALVAWEGLARARPPAASLLITVAVWICWQELPIRGVSADSLSLIYLAWAVPVAAALAARLYAPGVLARRMPAALLPDVRPA